VDLSLAAYRIDIQRWMRRLTQGGGALTFGKNRAKIYDESTRMQVTFNDVAGVDEAKVELEEVIDFLRQPPSIRNSADVFRKASCSSAAGTGKTLLAKAVAGKHTFRFSLCPVGVR